MKILYLCHRIPYPPNKGDKIRSFNEIKYLSTTHEVDLACLADDPGDLKYERDLKEYCKKICIAPLKPLKSKAKSLVSLASNRPLSVGYFYSGILQATVNHWLSSTSYDAIICFSSPMAEYILNQSTNQPINQSTKLIMDFCDVDSDKWLQYSRDSVFPLSLAYRIESRLLLRYEKRINQHFDHSVFVSQQEAELFLRLYPEARNVTVIPNGVDYNYFSPKPTLYTDPQPKKPIKLNKLNKLDKPNELNKPVNQQQNSPILLFTGAMDYYANVDGVIWFCNEIFPLIKGEFPDSQFFIVGSNPISKLKELVNRDGVTVTGFVEDIRPYYQMADVCVIPLRMARGVQNKVLEAMAMGKAVVTTAKAAEGIMAADGEQVLVEDTSQGFFNAVSKLVKDQKAGKALGTRAREFVAEKYDWSTNMKKFDTFL